MVLALLLRQRHGAGSEIQASLLNTGIFLLSELVRAPDGRFLGAPVNAASQLGRHPAESLYRTSDGWIAIAARGAAMSARLARALELHDLAAAGAARWSDADYERIGAVLARYSCAAALELLHGAQVWAEPCAADVGEVLLDPAMDAVGMLVTHDDPELGRFRQIGSVVGFETLGVAPQELGKLDRIGGHSREILVECGLSVAEIDALIEGGTVA
jgi:crotonobetainyl-CoA:carnitine CoA-transferase CaiB-like acyl-CoA transferase